MADWSERFDASYRFMRVSRATGLETELIGNIQQGGTIERNLDTDVKESGSVDVVGGLDLGADLVRVWLDATFPDGSTASEALGTFLVSTSERDVGGTSETAKADLSGRLKELDDSEFVEPFSVPSGTNLVQYAAGIVTGAGLSVESDASGYTSTEPLYYGVQPSGTDASSSSQTKLAVVNDLLARAGFDSARTDPMGTVLFRSSESVAGRPKAWSFVEGANARFLRDATDEVDKSGVANVVYAVYTWTDDSGDSGGQRTVIGRAVDDDPGSPWSTVSLGREVTARYNYDVAATQEGADAQAASLLEGLRSVARKVTLSHVYAPVNLSDGVAVGYTSAGIEGDFAVRTMKIELGPGCLTETELRQYVRA